MQLKDVLQFLGEKAIDQVFDYLNDLALDSIKNPTSETSRKLYERLKPIDLILDSCLDKIEEANSDIVPRPE